MIEIIRELRLKLDALEKEANRLEDELYRSKPHQRFHIGQWVRRRGDINEIGVVAWTSNGHLNINSENDGFFGLDIKTGNRGFRAPCRIDDYAPLNEEEVAYFTRDQKVEMVMSGEDIEWLKSVLRNQNTSTSMERIRRQVSRYEVRKEGGK